MVSLEELIERNVKSLCVPGKIVCLFKRFECRASIWATFFCINRFMDDVQYVPSFLFWRGTDDSPVYLLK